MPLISIIVPVYNVEPYFRRCLDSVIAQTFTDYECILVDDCSPDTCPGICDEYAVKDKRFKVIHKKQNDGLPKARKSGLDAACGEFIFHLDSDDWLEADALELLYAKQKETNAGIVLGGFNDVYHRQIRVYNFPEAPPETNPFEYALMNIRTFGMWGKLYKKFLFSDYIVPEVNIGEDVIVNTQIYLKAAPGSLRTISRAIYNYDHSSGMTSRLTRNYKSYKEYPAMIPRIFMEGYIETHTSDKNIQQAFAYYMIVSGINIYLRANKNSTREEINFFYERYYQGCIHKSKMKFNDKIVIPLMRFSIPLGRFVVLALLAGTMILQGKGLSVLLKIVKRK